VLEFFFSPTRRGENRGKNVGKQRKKKNLRDGGRESDAITNCDPTEEWGRGYREGRGPLKKEGGPFPQ